MSRRIVRAVLHELCGGVEVTSAEGVYDLAKDARRRGHSREAAILRIVAAEFANTEIPTANPKKSPAELVEHWEVLMSRSNANRSGASIQPYIT